MYQSLVEASTLVIARGPSDLVWSGTALCAGTGDHILGEEAPKKRKDRSEVTERDSGETTLSW